MYQAKPPKAGMGRLSTRSVSARHSPTLRMKQPWHSRSVPFDLLMTQIWHTCGLPLSWVQEPKVSVCMVGDAESPNRSIDLGQQEGSDDYT